MPRATAGNRHGVLRQPLGVLLKVTDDRFRQLGQTRHGALQGQVRLRGDEPPHRRLAPLGQAHPLGHQAWPVVRLGRLVPGEPLAKVRDRVGGERRAGEGEAKRKAAPTNIFTNESHAGGTRKPQLTKTLPRLPQKRFGGTSALRVGEADGGACCPLRAGQSQTAGTAIPTLTQRTQPARCGGGAASSRGRRRSRQCAGAPPAPGGTGQ